MLTVPLELRQVFDQHRSPARERKMCLLLLSRKFATKNNKVGLIFLQSIEELR